MEYPKDFPEHLKPPVDNAIAQAEIDFLTAKKKTDYWSSEAANRLIYRYIYSVFPVFASQACRAFEQGKWNGERVRRALDKFLDSIIRYVHFEKHPSPDEYSHSNFWSTATRSIKNSEAWSNIQAELKQVSAARASAPPHANQQNPSVTKEPLRHFKEPNPELLKNTETVNKKQAAAALGVSSRTLDRYVRDTRLVPVGGYARRRFKTKELLSFIARKERDK